MFVYKNHPSSAKNSQFLSKILIFLISRDYNAEIFAFTNRIGVQNVDRVEIVKALTTATYQERADVEGGSGAAAPSLDDSYGFLDNQDLISKGFILILTVKQNYSGQKDLEDALKPFLRCNMSSAPEELIEVVVDQITSEDVLADIALSIGKLYFCCKLIQNVVNIISWPFWTGNPGNLPGSCMIRRGLFLILLESNRFLVIRVTVLKSRALVRNNSVTKHSN